MTLLLGAYGVIRNRRWGRHRELSILMVLEVAYLLPHLVTVQQLDAPERKYAYFTWSLAADGKRLDLKSVNTDLVPKETRDSATIEKILRENLENPELLKDAGHFP